MDSFLVVWSATNFERFLVLLVTAGLFLFLSGFFSGAGSHRVKIYGVFSWLGSLFLIRILVVFPLALLLGLSLLILAWFLVLFAPSVSNRIAIWSEARLPDAGWYWRG